MKLVLLSAISAAVTCFSCKNAEKRIADASDYNIFLNNAPLKKKVERVKTEAAFWENRLLKDTGDLVNMTELARYQLSLFKSTGDIRCLLQGDSLLNRCSQKLNNTSPELFYSLSQNAVTRHDFIRSANCIEGAVAAKGDPYTIRLLQFDTYMELGRYNEAYKSLSSLKDKTGFDYIIRQAKWEDHNGNLDGAITLMETALGQSKGKNEARYLWTLSNLSDMYGHAGRIADAYKGYIEVLKKDPADLYCLKGIAWIAFSHDHNNTEARRIVNYILSQTAMPDLHLLLADIALQEGNIAERKKVLGQFLSLTANPAYGNMYNKYLIEIYTEDTKEYDKALSLAETEIKNRFTPETCSWLAWSYFKKGDMQKATELADKFVLNKSHEPGTKYLLACIYAGAGEKTKARALFSDCLESSFEIGPVMLDRIKAESRSL